MLNKAFIAIHSCEPLWPIGPCFFECFEEDAYTRTVTNCHSLHLKLGETEDHWSSIANLSAEDIVNNYPMINNKPIYHVED